MPGAEQSRGAGCVQYPKPWLQALTLASCSGRQQHSFENTSDVKQGQHFTPYQVILRFRITQPRSALNPRPMPSRWRLAAAGSNTALRTHQASEQATGQAHLPPPLLLLLLPPLLLLPLPCP